MTDVYPDFRDNPKSMEYAQIIGRARTLGSWFHDPEESEEEKTLHYAQYLELASTVRRLEHNDLLDAYIQLAFNGTLDEWLASDLDD